MFSIFSWAVAGQGDSRPRALRPRAAAETCLDVQRRVSALASRCAAVSCVARVRAEGSEPSDKNRFEAAGVHAGARAARAQARRARRETSAFPAWCHPGPPQAS